MILTAVNDNFQMKMVILFIIFAKNKDFVHVRTASLHWCVRMIKYLNRNLSALPDGIPEARFSRVDAKIK